MRESESRRAAIVKRLLNLNLSTRKELQDIVKLTSVICKTPVVLITLLDDEKQYIEFKTGTDADDIPIDYTFCRYTILQNAVMEVPDALLDERFVTNPLVTQFPKVRFYAGSPLVTQSGESLGSLCVLDNKPNLLNEDQKQMLQILSRQVTTILEFELSLKLLKEEITKVQDSEIKLKSIFQSSPTAHILVDKEMRIMAFNKAAADFILLLNKKIIKEGELITSLLSEHAAAVFNKHFKTAIAGERVCIEQMVNYGLSGTYWWEIAFNPVFDHKDEVIGVSLDTNNITERTKANESIIAQNAALKEIAQIQSHEIRRPVANIRGLLDVLETPDNDDYALHVQYIKDEAQALDKIIHHIVQLAHKKLK